MLKRLIMGALALVLVSQTGCGLQFAPQRALPAEYVESASITDAAVALVGRGPAERAAEEAVDFSLRATFNPDLLDPTQETFSPDELTTPLVREALAPGALSAWIKMVEQAVAGDEDAEDQIRGLVMFGLRQPTWEVAENGQILYSQAISNLVVDVAPSVPEAKTFPLSGSERPDAEASEDIMLSVSFTQVARLRFVENHYPFEVTYTRSALYLMVPSGSAESMFAPRAITTVSAIPIVPPQPQKIVLPAPKAPKPPRTSHAPV